VHARGVPRLAEERHDLALALPPCQVDGRPAVLVSKRRIGAPFEKALGDREVAVACRAMQCCIIADVLGIDLDGLGLEEEADAPFVPVV